MGQPTCYESRSSQVAIRGVDLLSITSNFPVVFRFPARFPAASSDCDMTDLEKIIAYIKANNILTVCSVRGDIPWAASCFYAFDREAVEFFCLSALDTRHGAEMLDNPKVAGTISSQQVIIAKIRGLQYSGTARLLEGERERVGRAIYNKRYPFARLHAAPLWSISVDVLKYTDNSFGFGTKLLWERPV
jgi:hypothetical protein